MKREILDNPIEQPGNKLVVYPEPILGQRVEVTKRISEQESAKTWEAIARLSAYPKMFEKLKGIQDWFDSLPRDEKGRIF